MKILQINIFGNLSTGRIAADLYRTARNAGHDGVVAFARNSIAEDVPSIKIGTRWSVYADWAMSRLTDRAGFYSRHATKRLIGQIRAYDPDIIHLHNLHGYYINIDLLFAYLREAGKPVVWTLHDCWAFTGHCCYYSMAGCGKWRTGCSECPQSGTYPKSLFVDNSKWNYQKKKELFTSLPNLHLVCVSEWLAGEVRQSFLKDIPRVVIYNGIDTEVFKPTESAFRKRNGLEGKKVVLGVASTWSLRKGLADFIRLSQMLDDRFRIVLVGISDRDRKRIPANVLCLGRTGSVRELAEIYTAADVFFNASVEETFGLPTVEAAACGTPAIVYDATALPEAIGKRSGYVVRPHDLDAVAALLRTIGPADHAACREESKRFDAKKQYLRYLELYDSICPASRIVRK